MSRCTARTVRASGGFTLLEVMIALGILVVSLVILVETQATAMQMTQEAERIFTATQLAQEKLSEVRMLVEAEGFSSDDVSEEGDFSDLGDDVINVEFEDLELYQWEYLITPVDLEELSDLNAVAGNVMKNLGMGGGADAPPLPDLSALGIISPEMITEALDPHVREVKVRVWWGEDPDEAEELGNEVILTTHVVNPNAQMLGGGGTQNPNQGNPQNPQNPQNPRNPGGPQNNPGGNPFGGGAGQPFGGGAGRPQLGGGVVPRGAAGGGGRR